MVVQGGAVALRETPDIVEEDALSTLGWTEPTKTVQGVAEKRAEARMKAMSARPARMRELHAGAEWHVSEMRDVRFDNGVFVS